MVVVFASVGKLPSFVVMKGDTDAFLLKLAEGVDDPFRIRLETPSHIILQLA